MNITVRLVPFVISATGILAGCTPSRTTTAPAPVRGPVPVRVIPLPESITSQDGPPFTITATTAIVVDTANAEALRVAEMLADLLRPPTTFALPITASAPDSVPRIRFRIAADRTALGTEGYELVSTRDSLTIVAGTSGGLFNGMQTLRQLLPAQVESHIRLSNVTWATAPMRIVDRPRFAWRGAMLDVARHFFTVREVEDYIDVLALYKINVLHLHLADDQGWRIEIKSRPKLATMGGATEVAGGPGGFYTQDDYTAIVRYAQQRHVMIVPEIDMPAHINAALVAYPELSCSERPTALYTGIDVGWSAICPDKEESYALLDDIIREISALTPGPYFHIGGDEVRLLKDPVYVKFIERVQDIVSRHGKSMVGWEEIAKATLKPTSIAQQWKSDSVGAVKWGAKVVLSPASRMYLDMKYTPATELGLDWAGLVEVRDAYDWNPAAFSPALAEKDIVGLEAPIWSETVRNITAVQYLALPRLPALAEVAWTPQSRRVWDDFRVRLAAHGARWNYLGLNYYRSADPLVEPKRPRAMAIGAWRRDRRRNCACCPNATCASDLRRLPIACLGYSLRGLTPR